MKKIAIALLSILIAAPSISRAEYIPSGCYVADSYRTDACWGEDATYLSWDNYSARSVQANNDYYGNAIATLIQQESGYRLYYQKVVKDLEKNKKLVKKLKSKCGSRCSGVR